MRIIDLIKLADIDRQVEIVIKNLEKYEKYFSYKEEKIRNVQEALIENLLNTEAKENNNDLLVFEKCWDSLVDDGPEEIIDVSFVKKDELREFFKNTGKITFPVIDTEKLEHDKYTEEELIDIIDSIPELPQPYSFIFSPWEDILGAEVFVQSIEETEMQECIYQLLYELSFNGITKEQQDKNRKDFETSMNSFKELGESDYISFDDMKERMGFKDDRTEEEKREDKRKMYINIIKTFKNRTDLINKIREFGFDGI